MADDVREGRPTGDEMLRRLETEGEVRQQGRLRVYLGMAPGVGKTFEMLQEAHRRVARGTDLVVGFVEAHGRPRTEELLAGLEIIPRSRIEYRGVALEEMDTDAVIERKPAVALVDELAHTNAPGSPRTKRWQDVDLIRAAGIDIISTCNVQHLESVADAVETIIGAPVHERLPDKVLLAADEIELVDMSPRALRQRMRHGNVYAADRAQTALDRFFTEANLTALRELSLRYVAERVDAQLEGIMAGSGRTEPWPVRERLLLLVDHRPTSRLVARRAASLAAALRAPLIAIAAVDDDSAQLPRDRSQDTRQHLEFAEELGATIVRPSASSLIDRVAEAARERHTTQVVLSRELGDERRGPLRRSFIDELHRRLPGLEVHIIGASDSPPERTPRP